MDDLAQSLAHLRRSYERAELDEAASLADPLAQFELWFKQALDAELPEPNAMTLATVGTDGRPSTRIVLIRGLDARGIVWYTNYASRKGRELEVNAHAALQFHWVELERVVRIEGTVSKVTAAESDAYFDSRPLASRIGAWASPQSEVIASRAVLEANASRFTEQFGLPAAIEGATGESSRPPDPARPPHWGGYRLQPDRWEFWQGRPSRLHDRLSYRMPDGHQEVADPHRTGSVWLRERLAP